jgi:hypothetical protein
VQTAPGAVSWTQATFYAGISRAISAMPAELISATMHSANGFDRDVRGISLGFVATQRCSLGEKDTGERITQKWNAGSNTCCYEKTLANLSHIVFSLVQYGSFPFAP